MTTTPDPTTPVARPAGGAAFANRCAAYLPDAPSVDRRCGLDAGHAGGCRPMQSPTSPPAGTRWAQRPDWRAWLAYEGRLLSGDLVAAPGPHPDTVTDGAAPPAAPAPEAGRCQACGGRGGFIGEFAPRRCPACGGSGRVHTMGDNFDRLRECVADARTALAGVMPPTPSIENPLYYPLLHLTEAVVGTLRDVLRQAHADVRAENEGAAAFLRAATALEEAPHVE